MKRTIVMHSALAPDQVIAALRRSVDEESRTLFSLSGFKGSSPVIGKIYESTFRVQKRGYWRNDYAPHFYGELHPEPGGTRIDGYFDIARWIKIYMYIWLSGVGLLGGPIFLISLFDLKTGTQHGSGNNWVGVAVPPAMFAFGYLLPKIGRFLGRGQEQFLLDYLQQMLAATIDQKTTPALV